MCAELMNGAGTNGTCYTTRLIQLPTIIVYIAIATDASFFEAYIVLLCNLCIYLLHVLSLVFAYNVLMCINKIRY